MEYDLDFVGPSPMRTVGRQALTSIVIHWWGRPALYRYPEAHDEVVWYLTAKRTENPSSANAVISPGRVTEIVEIKDIAWHAGNWPQNQTSVGYELMPFDEQTPRDQVERLFETAAAYLALVWTKAPQLVGVPLRMHKEFKGTECPGVWVDFLPDLFKRTLQLYPFVNPGSPGAALIGAPPLWKELFMQNPFVGRVTSEFGERSGGFHAGIDIAPPVAGTTGGPVYAAYAGTVEKVVTTQKPGSTTSLLAPGRTGNGAVVKNPDGERQVYNHVAPVVKVGQTLAKGALVGHIDRSGNQTGPHLHFETWGADGKPRDPRVDFVAAKVTPGVGAPVPARARAFLPLVVDGDWGHRTITELERALARAGLYKGQIEEDHGREAVAGPMLWAAYEQLLNGWNVGLDKVDGNFDKAAVEAEQRWLKGLNLYSFGIDGDRGPGTVSALQMALNAGKVVKNLPVQPPVVQPPVVTKPPVVEPAKPVVETPVVVVEPPAIGAEVVDQIATATVEKWVRRMREGFGHG